MKVGDLAMSNERKVEKTFVDLFAGVGGFRLGMEAAGHKCVGYVEIDKYARISYNAIHQTEGEFEGHDITSISDDVIRSIGRVDIIAGGFPCQAFSIAGKRRGFEDTRGTLFFEIMRWATVLKPKTLFLENVPGLLSHDEGITFETILRKMDEAGYDAEWDCLNACHFGVSQSRERIFLVGHSRKGRRRKVFPIERCNEQANLERIKKINRINNHSQVLFSKSEEAFSFVQKTTCIPILSPEREEKRLAPTLTTMQGGGQEPKVLLVREATKKGYAEAAKYDGINLSMPESETRRGRVAKQMTSTLDTGCQQGVVVEEIRIRKLTPRECWRLQGFPDWAFDAAAKVNSNSQLYKQAGNSVAVPVIVAIAENL
ncbi:DNA (cytosine-5-)-methyltransferase [Listeria monocytogenes]|nr:DNA (cytosine-5-)-methyltransferase [Listeria monocytogenes]EGL4193956.1 DNA (cytosine-5-)-methyltransferase [Listeria monocytogenes]EKN0226641.1 DNA (cytosine-5-)-methyltransferase [Listeria monocytogenes]EKZ4305810.1 DNA (cytosine-5-)-methyltransferase [Listeria monocytogenes]EKZ4314954.1 DNA (cytosine-5-)-methyltransferase [Listeria monocytogenes]